MATFSFNPPITLSEEGKWHLAVTAFETTNSVFSITNEINFSSIATPGHWSSRGGAETFNKLQNSTELRSQNDIELHVKEFEKKGLKIATDFPLSDLDNHKRKR